MSLEKEFVLYPEALELKHLGFDEPCFRVYDTLGFVQDEKEMDKLSLEKIQSPTYSQAFRFFRKKHNLFSSEVYDRGLNNGKIPIIHSYSFRILNLNNFEDFYGNVFKTYEEAELACLRKLIEIVKNK